MSSKRVRNVGDSKKRKKVRSLFRVIIRSVILNRTWLNDTGDQKLSLNVKKNIALLVRTQRKIGILTLAEKALIRMHPSNRSVEDRRKLTTLLASLNCFSRFPPKVRARLVPVVKFLYVCAGRKLIKEGDVPMTIYFILTGEIELSTRVFDTLKNDYYDKVEFIHGPGDCIGEVELIEDIPRRNTYTVTSDAEVLVIYDEDFDTVLRPVMAKQWMEKKLTVKTLDYFNFFNDEQVISACKLGMLRQFEPLESIYYEDKGQVSYVYFVISGECMILQCLKMKVTESQGKKSFELVDISKDDPSAMFQDSSGKKIMQKLNDDIVSQVKDTFDIDQEIASIESSQEDKRSLLPQKLDIKSIEIACGHRRHSGSIITNTDKDEIQLSEYEYEMNEYEEEEEQTEEEQTSTIVGVKRTFASIIEELMRQYRKEDDDSKPLMTINSSDGNKTLGETSDKAMDGDTRRSTKKSADYYGKDGTVKQSLVVYGDSYQANEDVEKRPTYHEKIRRRKAKKKHESAYLPFRVLEYDTDTERTDRTDNTQYSELEEEASVQTKDFESASTGRSWQKFESKKPRSRIENHFIDVGSLTYGGIFGLGEKIEHRVIMARTTVQCLLLPRFWLFERDQNPGNIWQRRRFYLDSTIPSRQSLFKDFLATRKWQHFKNDLIQSNLNPISTNNATKVQDIPIICRIVESHAD